jgi:hypothetical protein
MELKDIAALLSAIAWPMIAIVAGAILLKKTELITFLNAMYKGYSDKVAKAKSLPLPWGRIEIPDEVYRDLVVEKKTVSVEKHEGSYAAHIDVKELVDKYDAGTLLENIREYPSFNHNAVPLIEPTVGREGWYSVRLFLEFADDVPGVRDNPHRKQFKADQITVVHYLLHESFSDRRVISATIQEKGFEAWISLTDEFTVIAVVENKEGSRIALSRYLNLPRTV